MGKAKVRYACIAMCTRRDYDPEFASHCLSIQEESVKDWKDCVNDGNMVSKRRKFSGAMMTDKDSEADTKTHERRVARLTGITIYEICCEPLPLVYIGQTKRSLQVRIIEHKKKPPQKMKKHMQEYQPLDKYFTAKTLYVAYTK